MVISIILLVVIIILFVLGVTQLLKIGKPLNYEYMCASKERRKNMNKDLLFKQSGTISIIFSVTFCLLLCAYLTQHPIFTNLVFFSIVALLMYLVFSETEIQNDKEKREKEKKDFIDKF